MRWLLRGQVLKRVYELREETVTVLNKQNHVSLAKKFSLEKFISNVTDIYNSLNSPNQSMQGARFTVIDHAAKITAYYKKKLILWQTYVDPNEFSMFHELEKYIAGKRINKRHHNRTPREA